MFCCKIANALMDYLKSCQIKSEFLHRTHSFQNMCCAECINYWISDFKFKPPEAAIGNSKKKEGSSKTSSEPHMTCVKCTPHEGTSP